MSESAPSILITGANGFIGSRLCRMFVERGFQVMAGVRRTANLKLLEGLSVEYCYGDVTQPETLPPMVTGVDYIIHNAGLVKAPDTETFFRVNETGTRNLFEAVAKHNPGVRKVVYVSSVAVAGPSLDGQPVKETDPPNPVTTYGRSKAAGEKVALSFADRLPVVAVRPPAVYGPGDKELFTMFQVVHRHLKPLIGDSSRQLQLVYVDDLCDGIFLATTKPTPNPAVYFIAEKEAYSMKQLTDILHRASGRAAVPLPIPASLFKAIALVSSTAMRTAGLTPMLT
ncbi:MAG: SDR family NAD(P)-dependent oxidoreductase, partial [Candidatus Zixiibacteriota bacterium]